MDLYSSQERVIGYGLKSPGFEYREGEGISRNTVQTGSEAHPGSYPVGFKGTVPGVKQSGKASDITLPSIAAVTNKWSYVPSI
jgi:hypothetical protein